MDPQACLEQIRFAMKNNEMEWASACVDDLLEWCSKGGFPPKTDKLLSTDVFDDVRFNLKVQTLNGLLQQVVVQHFDIDLRWLLWTDDSYAWQGYDDVFAALEQVFAPATTQIMDIEVHTAPKKEIEYGVVYCRRQHNTVSVSGRFSCCWDSLYELAYMVFHEKLGDADLVEKCLEQFISDAENDGIDLTDIDVSVNGFEDPYVTIEFLNTFDATNPKAMEQAFAWLEQRNNEVRAKSAIAFKRFEDDTKQWLTNYLDYLAEQES